MFEIIAVCRRLARKCTQDEITVYAAQASFFLILALFPFLMLLLTLIQFIPSVGKADVLAILTQIMPDMLDSLMVSIVDDLYLKSPGTMLSVSAVAALWTASRGILGILKGLNRVYGTSERRNFLFQRVICMGYTLIFMIVCVLSLVLLVFGDTIQRAFELGFPLISRYTRKLISFRSLLATVLFLASFVFLYTVLPDKKQNPWHQIPGALLAAIGWLLFSYAFSIYFNNFSNYSYMYGSLAAVIMLMLWLYFCICILFLGGVVNEALGP